MIDLEKLLDPVSLDSSSGEDISYAADFMELDSLILGKPATQFSEAIEPDWKLLQHRCEDLSKRSKHLRVLTILCLTALKLDGFQGVAASLELLAKSIQLYWDTIYPRLDPDDNLDPLERVNILASLASPLGTYGDPYKYVEKLVSVPLCNSSSFGRYSFSSLPSRSGSGEKTPEVAKAEAAFLDTPPETLQNTFAAIDRAIRAVADMETFLDTTIGSSKSPNLEVLSRQLLDIRKAATVWSGHTAALGAEGDSATTTVEPSPTRTTSVNAVAAAGGGVGGIQSRPDVVKALDLICEYYRVSEPSSPVPLLLRRAQRLVEGDFLAIIDDLAPDYLSVLKTVTGVKDSAE